MATTLAKVAPPGTIVGLGRKETIYDSDVEADGSPVGNQLYFSNPAQFSNNAFNTFSKQNGAGVFTNMIGSGTGGPLPSGWKFGGYKVRLSPHSYDDDPTLLQNLAYWSDVRMLRAMGFLQIFTDQAIYMTIQGRDLVSWQDNERIALAAPSDSDVLCLTTPGTDHEGRALDVGQQPLVLEALQNWRGVYNVPVARTSTPNFSPVIPIVTSMFLDGVLVRPTG